jgi:hypothetical protein
VDGERFGRVFDGIECLKRTTSVNLSESGYDVAAASRPHDITKAATPCGRRRDIPGWPASACRQKAVPHSVGTATGFPEGRP